MAAALAAVLSSPQPCLSFESGAGFLDLPVGGRPLSLGGAYSALAFDAYAPVWNPAGLGGLAGSQIASMHVAFIESMSYDFVGFAHPIGKGRHGIGASVQYFTPGAISAMDAAGNPLGDLSGSYEAYALSYGLKINEALSAGAAAKLIHAQIGDLSAQSYAADVGAAYRASPRLTVGAAAANLGAPIRFIEEKEPLPRALRVGAAFQALPALMLAAEGVYSNADSRGARIGAEWRALEWTALRAGYRFERGRHSQGAAGFSTGLGIYFMGQQFDYAWVPMGELGSAQYFSLVLMLDRFLSDED